MNSILEKAEHQLTLLNNDKTLAKYVDGAYHIPQPYKGTGTIKLIVLGQDPTVKIATDRAKIKTVLNLDKKGSAKRYLVELCGKIGIDLKQNVYATNIFKNFFINPPTQIKEINIFRAFLPVWLPLLLEELSEFESVPVITLGEPVLFALQKSDSPKRLREYWGYSTEWKTGQFGLLDYIKPEGNLLGRTIFPFPHQPSLRKQFYKDRMDEYISFVRTNVFL